MPPARVVGAAAAAQAQPRLGEEGEHEQGDEDRDELDERERERKSALRSAYGEDFPLAMDTTPTEDDWVTWIKARWEAHRGGVQDNIYDSQRNRLFRRGIQWISSTANRGAWREPPLPKDAVRAVDNQIGPALDWALQVLSEQRRAGKLFDLQPDEALENVVKLFKTKFPGIDVQPTITAHPTEAKRVTVLEIHRRIYLKLYELESPRWTPRERDNLLAALKNEIDLLWLTGEIRIEKPTVESEIAWGLHFFRETLFDRMATLCDLLEAALQRHYKEGPPANWQEAYVSAYATTHPWEDFAETWAHYLHIVDTLEMADAFGLQVVVDRNFADGTAIVGDPTGFEIFEQQKGAISIDNPSTISRTIAWRGYFATLMIDDQKFVKRVAS